eukprot:gb/GECG01004292.1/.p1 GENE.gb/GECG01004292.1/~~gb/GECG01004292.1/.p1  ORF type:complete len:534 (+),score=47.45 gb/GECG01004292.1/:1-1602(+)
MLRFLQRRGLVADASFTKWPLPFHLDTAIHRSPVYSDDHNSTQAVHSDAVPGTERTLGAYAGFDPTAPSLHLGNLAVLMTLARLSMRNDAHSSMQGRNTFPRGQDGECTPADGGDHGDQVIPRFRPYIVVGGMTGRIGDPSGKSTERTALGAAEIRENLVGIRNSVDLVFEGIRQHGGLQLEDLECAQGLYISTNGKDEGSEDIQSQRKILSPIVVDNSTFYEKMPLWEFFGRIGKYFRLSSMLAKDTVASRLSEGSSGMSFTEFSYPLFQAYDFLHLFLNHGCVLQVGGSDQWGNITAGIDLIKRAKLDFSSAAIKDTKAFDPQGLTVPLLTTISGAKFGKSEGNALWLDPKLTTNYDLYQYLLNVADDDCEKLLSCLTFLDYSEISAILREHFSAPESRLAQRVLAEYLVYLLRGFEGMREAKTVTNILFGSNIGRITQQDMERAVASDQIPCLLAEKSTALSSSLLDLLIKAELVTSKSEGKRLLKSGGIYVNGEKCNSDSIHLQETDLLFGQYVIFRVGRKRHCILEIK